MKVRTLLLVAATLVVSAQSYGNIKKQRGSDPNISKNITGPTNNNSEECPFQTKIAKSSSSNAKDPKIALNKKREENR